MDNDFLVFLFHYAFLWNGKFVYNFCLMFHFLLILYICFPFFFNLLLLMYICRLSSKTSLPIWPTASVYPLLCISPLNGLVWMDKILLAQSCLDQEFLFILTSFSNLWLSSTLQSSWKFKLNYVREVVLFSFLNCPKFPKSQVFCLCDYSSFELRAFPLFPLTWVFLLQHSSFLPLCKE